MNDSYTTKSGNTLRVINDNILVAVDPLPEMSASGLVLYPNGSMEHVHNTGTVVAFGYTWIETADGPKRIPLPELEVGMRVVFIRFLAEQDSNKQVRLIAEEDVIRIKPNDILLTFPPDELAKLA